MQHFYFVLLLDDILFGLGEPGFVVVNLFADLQVALVINGDVLGEPVFLRPLLFKDFVELANEILVLPGHICKKPSNNNTHQIVRNPFHYPCSPIQNSWLSLRLTHFLASFLISFRTLGPVRKLLTLFPILLSGISMFESLTRVSAPIIRYFRTL